MRKVNKILMATVSILLCLVLISTSVVSGIFAKFAINNKGSASATFKAFGVTLDMTVDETKLINAGATVKTDEDKHKVTKSVTITGLKMAPGVELDKIITISLSGTPTVNCRFKLDIDLDFDMNKFIIPGGVFSEIGGPYMYFPVIFPFGRIDEDNNYIQYNYGCKIRSPESDSDPLDDLYDVMVYSGIYFYDKGGYDDGSKYLYRDFPAGEPILLHTSELVDIDYDAMKFIYAPDTSFSFEEFDMGLSWPFSSGDKEDEYETYIINQNPNGLDFTYKVTVSVEQIIPE